MIAFLSCEGQEGRKGRATIFDQFGFTVERVAEVGRGVVRDGLRGRVPTLVPSPHPGGRT